MNRGIFDDPRRQISLDQLAQQQAGQNLFEGMGGWGPPPMTREAMALESVRQARLAQGFGDNAFVASFPQQYAQWNVPQVAMQPNAQWNMNPPYAQWNVPYQQWNQPQFPQLSYDQQAFQPGYQYNQFMQPHYGGGGIFGLLQRFGIGGYGPMMGMGGYSPMMGMGGFGPMGMGGMRLPFIGNMFGGHGFGGHGFRMPHMGRGGGLGGIFRRFF